MVSCQSQHRDVTKVQYVSKNKTNETKQHEGMEGGRNEGDGRGRAVERIELLKAMPN